MLEANIKTSFYVFYTNKFIENYRHLESAFRSIYPEYHIAYSFKTNYTSAVCNLVKELGDYAEVVSEMEYTLVQKVGFVIYNGPGKEECLREGMLSGDYAECIKNKRCFKY